MEISSLLFSSRPAPDWRQVSSVNFSRWPPTRRAAETAATKLIFYLNLRGEFHFLLAAQNMAEVATFWLAGWLAASDSAPGRPARRHSRHKDGRLLRAHSKLVLFAATSGFYNLFSPPLIFICWPARPNEEPQMKEQRRPRLSRLSSPH